MFLSDSNNSIISVVNNAVIGVMMKKEERKCKKCGIVTDQYYKSNPATCKSCICSGVRKNRKKNIEHYKEFDRKRASLPHRVKARKEYVKTEKGKEVHNKSSRKWAKNNINLILDKQKIFRENYPEILYAREQVAYAVKTGKLIRPNDCSNCGDEKYKIHGHHPDYSKPLEVVWLCPKCHTEEHKRIDNEQ